jgi:hypothetical protein
MDAQTPDKPKQTRQPKKEHLCYVHDKCDDYNRKSIHKSVCRDLETTEHTNGKHYCLLHLPTKEKDADKFQQIIDERFDGVAKGIVKIEAELPEADWKEAKAKLRYDCRFVWFHQDIIFHEKTFGGCVNFSFANFNGLASFSSATFSGDAYFDSTVFKCSANFSCSKFGVIANFCDATFGNPNKSNENNRADFNSVHFRSLLPPIFSNSTFYCNAFFNDAKSESGNDTFLGADFKGFLRV